LEQRRARGTDRTAVDAGGLHGDEEPSVEPCVAAPHRPVAGVFVQYHAPGCYRSARGRAGGNRTPTKPALCGRTAADIETSVRPRGVETPSLTRSLRAPRTRRSVLRASDRRRRTS